RPGQRPDRHPPRGAGAAHPGRDRLDPVLAVVRRARDHHRPHRQHRAPPARGPQPLGRDRRAPRPHPRSRRRDPPLRSLRPSVPVWRRVTARRVALAGVDLPAGARLFLWLAAAGRDEEAFDRPADFDMSRTDAARHLAFGKGLHYCLGANLGKLETQIALAELARRYPALRLVPDQRLTFHPNIPVPGPPGPPDPARPRMRPPHAAVEAFLAQVPNDQQREDARRLCAMMQEITGEPPVMWGSSIIGFGTYHYRYASGHEGDSA